MSSSNEGPQDLVKLWRSLCRDHLQDPLPETVTQEVRTVLQQVPRESVRGGEFVSRRKMEDGLATIYGSAFGDVMRSRHNNVKRRQLSMMNQIPELDMCRDKSFNVTGFFVETNDETTKVVDQSTSQVCDVLDSWDAQDYAEKSMYGLRTLKELLSRMRRMSADIAFYGLIDSPDNTLLRVLNVIGHLSTEDQVEANQLLRLCLEHDDQHLLADRVMVKVWNLPRLIERSLDASTIGKWLFMLHIVANRPHMGCVQLLHIDVLQSLAASCTSSVDTCRFLLLIQRVITRFHAEGSLMLKDGGALFMRRIVHPALASEDPGVRQACLRMLDALTQSPFVADSILPSIFKDAMLLEALLSLFPSGELHKFGNHVLQEYILCDCKSANMVLAMVNARDELTRAFVPSEVPRLSGATANVQEIRDALNQLESALVAAQIRASEGGLQKVGSKFDESAAWDDVFCRITNTERLRRLLREPPSVDFFEFANLVSQHGERSLLPLIRVLMTGFRNVYPRMAVLELLGNYVQEGEFSREFVAEWIFPLTMHLLRQDFVLRSLEHLCVHSIKYARPSLCVQKTVATLDALLRDSSIEPWLKEAQRKMAVVITASLAQCDFDSSVAQFMSIIERIFSLAKARDTSTRRVLAVQMERIAIGFRMNATTVLPTLKIQTDDEDAIVRDNVAPCVVKILDTMRVYRSKDLEATDSLFTILFELMGRAKDRQSAQDILTGGILESWWAASFEYAKSRILPFIHQLANAGVSNSDKAKGVLDSIEHHQVFTSPPLYYDWQHTRAVPRRGNGAACVPENRTILDDLGIELQGYDETGAKVYYKDYDDDDRPVDILYDKLGRPLRYSGLKELMSPVPKDAYGQDIEGFDAEGRCVYGEEDMFDSDRENARPSLSPPPRADGLRFERYIKFSQTKAITTRVWRGVHTETGTRLIVKTIDKAGYSADYLARELECLREVKGEGIVPLVEIVNGEKYVHIATKRMKIAFIDYLENLDRELTENETKEYIRQIVAIVNRIHERGWLHWDLKVDNFVLDYSGNRLLVIDFGHSCRLDGRDENGLLPFGGTDSFMSLEQWVRTTFGRQLVARFPRQSEYWSVGCIMHSLLTNGHSPYPKELREAVMKGLDANDPAAFLNAEAGALPDLEDLPLSPNGRKFLQACLTVDPAKRITREEFTENHPWFLEDDDVRMTDDPPASPKVVEIVAKEKSSATKSASPNVSEQFTILITPPEDDDAHIPSEDDIDAHDPSEDDDAQVPSEGDSDDDNAGSCVDEDDSNGDRSDASHVDEIDIDGDDAAWEDDINFDEDDSDFDEDVLRRRGKHVDRRRGDESPTKKRKIAHKASAEATGGAEDDGMDD